MSKIQAKQDKIEEDVSTIRADMTELKKDLVKVHDMAKAAEVKLETIIEAMLVEGLEKHLESTVDDKVKHMREDVEECLVIEKRKNNLIFYGMKESEILSLDFDTKHPDQEMIEEVLKSGLKLDASRHIEEVQRIGRLSKEKLDPLRSELKHLKLGLR